MKISKRTFNAIAQACADAIAEAEGASVLAIEDGLYTPNAEFTAKLRYWLHLQDIHVSGLERPLPTWQRNANTAALEPSETPSIRPPRSGSDAA